MALVITIDLVKITWHHVDKLHIEQMTTFQIVLLSTMKK